MLTADSALQAGIVLHAWILPQAVEGQAAGDSHLGESQWKIVDQDVAHAALEADLVYPQSLADEPAAHLLLNAAKEDALLEIYARLGLISVSSPITARGIVED